MRRLVILAAVLLSAAAPTPAPSALDAAARDYVQLVLELGERDPGYVDAYYGPAAWQAAAKRSPRGLDALAAATRALVARLHAIPTRTLAPFAGRRRDFLVAQLDAAAMRIRMLKGEKPGFAVEARGLFGVDVHLKPLSDYDAVLARVEALVPGEGALPDRIAAVNSSWSFPPTGCAQSCRPRSRSADAGRCNTSPCRARKASTWSS